MVLTHLDTRPGEVLVRLPDGSTQWVKVADMIALANSDKPSNVSTVVATKEAVTEAMIGGGKPKTNRKR